MTPMRVRRMIANAELNELKDLLNQTWLTNLIGIFEELDGTDLVIAFRLLTKDLAIDVFDGLSVSKQADLINLFEKDEVVEYFKSLDVDDRVRLLDELPARVTKKLVNKMDPRSRELINVLMGFPDDSAGRNMSPRYLSGREGHNVAAMLDRIRASPLRPDEMDMVYLIDSKRAYLGHLRLGSLLKESPDTMLVDLATLPEVYVKTTDDRETARDLMMTTDLPAIPVLDSEGRLVGSLTFDDVMDVAEEEATEDFHRLAAIHSPMPTMNIREAGFQMLFRARIPWLLALVGMNVFSGAGIAYFEGTIEAAIALVFFLPLLIDSGGNAGSQAATLTVRAMAIGDVKMRDWAQMMVKELKVALALGVAMAVAVSALGWYRAGPEVAVVVSLTMVCVVIIGSLVGMTLPFLLSKIKLDPATASGPLVTSIADILGVLVYFGIATWYLGI